MAAAKKNIVSRDFFCIKTKKNWKKGQEYKGKRKDLGDVLISQAEYDSQEKKRAENNAKIAKADAKLKKEIGQHGVAKHKPEKKK